MNLRKIITARSFSVPAGRTRVMVRTADDWRAAQASYLQWQRDHGVPLGDGRVVSDAIEARIDGGQWLIDCECGSGAIVEPAWGLALCMGCGNEYDHVTLPPNWQAIEAVLLKRPNLVTRHSTTPTLQGRVVHDVAWLTAENAAHGIV